MKPLKSKKAMAASIILASVALGGVGFSAWVINASNQTQDLNNVQVGVGEFNDNRFTLSKPNLSDGNVVFDWDGKSGELVGGSGKNTEDLHFTFSTTLTGSVGQLDGINLQLKTNASLSTLLGNEETKATIQSPLEPGAEATEIIPGEAFTNPTGQAVQSDAKFANASGPINGGSKWSYTVTSAGNSSYTIELLLILHGENFLNMPTLLK